MSSLRTTASTSRAQGPYNLLVLAGIISSHVKTASEERPGPHSTGSGGGRGEGGRQQGRPLGSNSNPAASWPCDLGQVS